MSLFACLFLPRDDASRPLKTWAVQEVASSSATIPADGEAGPTRAAAASYASATLAAIAAEFSPRVEIYGRRLVVLDVGGLERLLGDPRTIGIELRKAAAARGLAIHVAIAVTCTAALLLAQARPGLTIVPAGDEAMRLAPLPLASLRTLLPADRPRRRSRRAVTSRHYRLAPAPAVADTATPPVMVHDLSPEQVADILETLRRWGLHTLGDLAALPPADVFERLGPPGVALHRRATGRDDRPLVPCAGEPPFEATLALEWPVEGLQPLSFVLGRVCDTLCRDLERRDRGAAVLHVRLRLATREMFARTLQLPAAMRDPRVLRTLILLDLESHPPPAAVERVTVAADAVPGRIVQFSLLERALPAPERLSTLLARLTALMGEGQVGAPALPDTHRPGAFRVDPFAPPAGAVDDTGRGPAAVVLRRFRRPVPARVVLSGGRPAHLTVHASGLAGGRVTNCAGPWRTSGEWWLADEDASRRETPWDHDEWDVALDDGVVYRLFQDRQTERWYVGGMGD